MSPQRRSGLGTNQEAIRRHNLGTVLRHVHSAGEMSRAELTSLMGLNRSTIAGLVGELESLGISERADPVEGVRQGAGRPSAGVRIAADGPYVIAVDLGVDRAVVARVGLGGRVLQRAQAPVHSDGEAWQVGAAVAALIRTVVEDAPAASPLVGIGISVPGLVRRSDGLIRLAPNLEWHDVSFGGIVLAALGLDVPVSPGQRRRPRRARRAHPRRGRRHRRAHLHLRQRRRRCRHHHRRPPARGSRRLRRRGRPPALQPRGPAVPLRQPRLLGDRGRRPRHRRGDPVPARQGRRSSTRCSTPSTSRRRRCARPAPRWARAWPAWSTCSTRRR